MPAVPQQSPELRILVLPELERFRTNVKTIYKLNPASWVRVCPCPSMMLTSTPGVLNISTLLSSRVRMMGCLCWLSGRFQSNIRRVKKNIFTISKITITINGVFSCSLIQELLLLYFLYFLQELQEELFEEVRKLLGVHDQSSSESSSKVLWASASPDLMTLWAMVDPWSSLWLRLTPSTENRD